MACPAGYSPEVWKALPLPIRIELLTGDDPAIQSTLDVPPPSSNFGGRLKRRFPSFKLETTYESQLRSFNHSNSSACSQVASLPICDEWSKQEKVARSQQDKIDNRFRETGIQYLDQTFLPELSSLDGNHSHPSVTENPPPNPMCKCNLPAKLCEVSKQNRNMGRKFWGCQQRKCNFFSWAANYGHSKQALAVVWARPMPAPFYPPVVKKCRGAPSFESKDIAQGKLGDCWFLAALATVAEMPELISNLVITKERSASGCYQIKLFVDGEWKVVTIDDCLPRLPTIAAASKGLQSKQSMQKTKRRVTKTMQDRTKTTIDSLRTDTNDTITIPCLPLHEAPLAYSGAEKNQLWVPLVEKAYAKVHGSYSALSGGWVAEALFDLTSFPTETLLLNFDEGITSQENLDVTWIKLWQFNHERYPMGASCVQPSKGSGLVGGHAYSIINLEEITNAKVGVQTTFKSSKQSCAPNLGMQYTWGSSSQNQAQQLNPSLEEKTNSPLRLVQLRNPWGRKRAEWKGKFSKNSNEWTPELRTMLNITDDSFWMTFQDFVNEFYQVDVCRATPDWYSHSLKSQVPIGSEFPKLSMKLSVPEATKASLSVIQPTKRGKVNANYFYEAMGVCVVKLFGDQSRKQLGQVALFTLNGQCKCVHHDLMLDAGDYVAVVWCISRGTQSNIKAQSNPATPASFTLRVLTAKPGTASNTSLPSQICANIVQHCVIERCRVNCQETTTFRTNTVVQSVIDPNQSQSCVVIVHSRAGAIAIVMNGTSTQNLEVSFLLHGPGEGATNCAPGMVLPCYTLPPLSMRLVAVVSSVPLQDYETGLSDSLEIGTGIYGSFALDKLQFVHLNATSEINIAPGFVNSSIRLSHVTFSEQKHVTYDLSNSASSSSKEEPRRNNFVVDVSDVVTVTMNDVVPVTMHIATKQDDMNNSAIILDGDVKVNANNNVAVELYSDNLDEYNTSESANIVTQGRNEISNKRKAEESIVSVDLVSSDDDDGVLLDCAICFESQYLSSFSEPLRCGHSFCNTCLASYLDSQMEAGKKLSDIRCPNHQCAKRHTRGTISEHLVRKLVGEKAFARYEKLSILRFVEQDPTLFLCPVPDCTYVVSWLGPQDGPPKLFCPNCRKASCIKCGVTPYHESATCGEAAQASSSAEALSVSELQAQNIKICARCKQGIQLSEGCMKLQCRCGYVFCYQCGTPKAKCKCTPNSHTYHRNKSDNQRKLPFRPN